MRCHASNRRNESLADSSSAELAADKQVLKVQTCASPGSVMIEENRKAGRLAVPFGDQGAKLGVVAKPITRNVRLRRSDQLGLAFKLGELPDHLSQTGTSSTMASLNTCAPHQKRSTRPTRITQSGQVRHDHFLCDSHTAGWVAHLGPFKAGEQGAGERFDKVVPA